MTFEEWWKLLKPAECDEVKPQFEECWQAGRDAMRQEAMKVCLKWHDSLASEPEMLDIANEIGELK